MNECIRRGEAVILKHFEPCAKCGTVRDIITSLKCGVCGETKIKTLKCKMSPSYISASTEMPISYNTISVSWTEEIMEAKAKVAELVKQRLTKSGAK